MIQLNLFIDVDADVENVLDDIVLKSLKDNGIIANGSVKDMDGKVVCFVVNGQRVAHLFLSKEVNDGNNGDDPKSEEFTQLDFNGIIATIRDDCYSHGKPAAGGIR